MSLVTIGEAGLRLESSPKAGEKLPVQVLGLTLTDSVIEDMIKSVQNGNKIELSLGGTPTFHYGNHNHALQSSQDSSDYDIYLAKNPKSATKAQRLANPTMSIFEQCKNYKRAKSEMRAEKTTATRPKKSTAAAASSPDSDLEREFEADKTEKITKTTTKSGAKTSIEAKKSKATTKKPVPPTSKAKTKTKATAAATTATATSTSNSTATKSIPASPSLKNPATPPLNAVQKAQQQMLETYMTEQFSVIHELAVKDQTFDYLAGKWKGSSGDLKSIMNKVAENKDGKWNLRKLFWKHLDPWAYDYAAAEDRQTAIDNAVRQLRKARVTASDERWRKLLKKEDRDNEEVLSKLQANLVRDNVAHAPKSTNEGGSVKGDSDESSLAKSSSQTSTTTAATKAKYKADTQAKRLLSKNSKAPKKPVAPKKSTTATQTSTPISGPVKRTKAAEAANGRYKSAEFVQDSDSSGEDEPAPIKAKQPAVKASEKPMEKATAPAPARLNNDKPKSTPSSLPAKPKPSKPVVRPPRTTITKPSTTAASNTTTTTASQKRPRDDDESSSSSGTPLSKRVKTKEVPKAASREPPRTSTEESRKPLPTVKEARKTVPCSAPAAAPKVARKTIPKDESAKPASKVASPAAPISGLKSRASDSAQPSRSATSSNPGLKNKTNTSPVKSSPLAASPPTNASEFEERPPMRRAKSPVHRPSTNGHATNNKMASTSSESAVVKKRKAIVRERDDEPPTKKPRITEAMLRQAEKFRTYHTEYKEKHARLSAMARPSKKDVADLNRMRSQLIVMKEGIWDAVGGRPGR